MKYRHKLFFCLVPLFCFFFASNLSYFSCACALKTFSIAARSSSTILPHFSKNEGLLLCDLTNKTANRLLKQAFKKKSTPTRAWENNKKLLSKIPPRLLNDKSLTYRVKPIDSIAIPTFIDIRVSGPFHKAKLAGLVGGTLLTKCLEQNLPIFTRPSQGFFHPNFSLILGEKTSTVRLTLGPDPGQIAPLVKCFETIDSLND